MIPAALFRNQEAGTPVLGGAERPYAYLDHAASTPPLAAVVDAVNAFVPWYANVHRGQGFKSRYSSRALEHARDAVMTFLHADPATHVAVFTRNATEALNHAARRWPIARGAVIVTTGMEHHSNDLPWRRAARVVHAQVDATGAVDEDHLRDLLRRHQGKVALLAVTGASNVTGILNPVHRWAAWAHAAGARIVVDGAQLLPHRTLEIKGAGDPEHIDAVAFSAHKMYAPFGAGVLVAPREILGTGEPVLVGGGTVDLVSLERAVWTGLPDREEAGTPDVVGAVALGAAIRKLDEIGWDDVEAHEAELGARLVAGLARNPGVTMYGRGVARDQLAVVAFNIDGVPHGLTGAILDHEWAIGTRCGCFCAHPYVKALLRLSPDEVDAMEAKVVAGDRSALPGMVRASVGLASSLADVDRLIEAVTAIAAGRHSHDYALDRATGEYTPPEAAAVMAKYFHP